MTSTQWANIGDDAGALHALVEQIRDHAAIASIDYLWLFPSRKVAAGESIVMVIGAFDDDPERRRVSTAHFTVSRNRKGAATVNLHYDEHGSAPVAAVPRIVQGVLRRLGEDSEASPREESIGGDPDRWNALIIDLGGAPRPSLLADDDAGSEAADSETAGTAETAETADLAGTTETGETGETGEATGDTVEAAGTAGTAGTAGAGDPGEGGEVDPVLTEDDPAGVRPDGVASG